MNIKCVNQRLIEKPLFYFILYSLLLFSFYSKRLNLPSSYHPSQVLKQRSRSSELWAIRESACRAALCATPVPLIPPNNFCVWRGDYRNII